MAIYNSRLGDLLVERRLITSSQLNEAVCLQQHTHLKLGEVLVAHNLLTSKQLNRTLKIQQELRRTILTTLICIAPFQFPCASEQEIYTEFHPKLLSSPYGHDLEPKLSLSFTNLMQGANYLFDTNKHKHKQHEKSKKQADEQSMLYDISFGKDSFSIDMHMSF